jgi:hypothetical protein
MMEVLQFPFELSAQFGLLPFFTALFCVRVMNTFITRERERDIINGPNRLGNFARDSRGFIFRHFCTKNIELTLLSFFTCGRRL